MYCNITTQPVTLFPVQCRLYSRCVCVCVCVLCMCRGGGGGGGVIKRASSSVLGPQLLKHELGKIHHGQREIILAISSKNLMWICSVLFLWTLVIYSHYWAGTRNESCVHWGRGDGANQDRSHLGCCSERKTPPEMERRARKWFSSGTGRIQCVKDFRA